MKRKRKFGWLPVALGLLVFAATAVWMVRAVGQTAEASGREGLRMAEQAVRRAAVSCYALEGAYPASYEDLKERTGVAGDEKRYGVVYEDVAANVVPEITVVERWGEG